MLQLRTADEREALRRYLRGIARHEIRRRTGDTPIRPDVRVYRAPPMPERRHDVVQLSRQANVARPGPTTRLHAAA